MEKTTFFMRWGKGVEGLFTEVPIASYYEGVPCFDMMTARFMQEIAKCFERNGIARMNFCLAGLEDAMSTREKQAQYIECLDALIKKEQLNGTYDGDILLHATNFTNRGD